MTPPLVTPPPLPGLHFPSGARARPPARRIMEAAGTRDTGTWDTGGAGPFGCTLFLCRLVYIQCLQSSAVIPADHPRVPLFYPLLTGLAWTECRRVGSFGLCAWVGVPDPRGTLLWHPVIYSLLPGQPRAPLVCPRLQAMPGLSVLWSGPFGLCAGLTWGPTPGELFFGALGLFLLLPQRGARPASGPARA